MTTTKTFKGNGADKILAEKIIKKVTETGHLPWEMPWDKRINAYSYASKKPFCLVNKFLLDHEGGYVSFNEIKKKGYQFKPEYEGVKGLAEPVFMRWLTEKEVLDKDGNPQMNADGEPLTRDYWSTRFFSEWSIGYLLDKDGKPLVDADNNDTFYNYQAEQVIANYFNRHGVTLVRNANVNQACFIPSSMTVNIPNDNRFEDSTLYYSTVFHEMVHSTGIELGRRMDGDKESKEYSFEELVAEIGAWILRGLCGIETVQAEENSTAYLQGWCNTFKEKPYWIMMAYSMADKAVKCITDGLDSTKELPYTEVKALPAPKEAKKATKKTTKKARKVQKQSLFDEVSREQKRGIKKMHTYCTRNAKKTGRPVLAKQYECKWDKDYVPTVYHGITDSYIAFMTENNIDGFEQLAEEETKPNIERMFQLCKAECSDVIGLKDINIDELKANAKKSFKDDINVGTYKLLNSYVDAKRLLTVLELMEYKDKEIVINVPKDNWKPIMFRSTDLKNYALLCPIRHNEA